MEELSREEAFRLLSEAPVAHLGVISEGRPYVTPMSFVVDGERILFRTVAGRKFRAIAENPNVCIEASRFDEQTGDWVSVVVTGTAKETKDPAAGSWRSRCFSGSMPMPSAHLWGVVACSP